MKRRNQILGLLLVLHIAAVATSILMRRYAGWPENTGDYPGPLTRAIPPYDPAKPPSRPWLDPQPEGAGPVLYRVFEPATIHARQTYFLIYLPPGYHDPTHAARRYPVIYWLHGFNCKPEHGAPFVEALDAAIRAGQCPPVIAVLPNGLNNTWYCDSADGAQPIESILLNDLIPLVDSQYRTLPHRNARAVEGFSMGGWGAAHLAIKHPNLFSAATMICAPIHGPKSFPQLHSIFNGRRDDFSAEDPVVRLRRFAPELKTQVRLRFFVGADERFSWSNRRLHARLTQWNFPHEFRTVPGVNHDTAQMYQRLGPSLFTFYADLFSTPPQ